MDIGLRLLGGDPHGLAKLETEAQVDIVAYWLAAGWTESPLRPLLEAERQGRSSIHTLRDQLVQNGASADAVSWWLED